MIAYFYSEAHTAVIKGMNNLQLLTNWARQWLVTFNPLKSVYCYTLDFRPQLVFDNIQIRIIDSHKRLDFT